jgi:hypothetical protein
MLAHLVRSGHAMVQKQKLHRVAPNCETRPDTLTENSYQSPKVSSLRLAHYLGQPCTIFVKTTVRPIEP